MSQQQNRDAKIGKLIIEAIEALSEGIKERFPDVQRGPLIAAIEQIKLQLEAR